MDLTESIAPGTAITLHAYTSADLDVIRAEAVENAAHLVIGTPGFNALRARAAEYREAASS